MIFKDAGTDRFYGECSTCGETIDLESREFQESVEEMKKQGWRTAKNADDQWVHFCKNCA